MVKMMEQVLVRVLVRVELEELKYCLMGIKVVFIEMSVYVIV